MNSDNAQPSMANLMAAIQGLGAKIDTVDAKTNAIIANVGQLRTEMNVKFDMVSADIAQLRADVLHAKVDATLAEARAKTAHDALNRHLNDPNPHDGRDAA